MNRPAFNTDIYVRGRLLHVQTQDWGPKHGVVVTQIFHQGVLLKTVRYEYATLARIAPPELSLEERVWWQHCLILDQIQAGHFGGLKDSGLN